jgi:hypothetical protein
MPAPTVARTVPILRIFSVEKAKEFYVDYLGFEIDWEHRFGDNFPLYMQVSLGALVLHLSEHHVEETPWRSISVTLLDPFGNRLVFDEKVER